MSKAKIGLVHAEFNLDFVTKLYKGALEELQEQGHQPLVIHKTPGVGELPLMTHWMLKKYKLDAVLACGVLIRGETSHYESLCRILENGLIHLQMHYSTPIIFSVIQAENHEQVRERLGGKKGHRGKQGAKALLQMLHTRTKNEME